MLAKVPPGTIIPSAVSSLYPTNLLIPFITSLSITDKIGATAKVWTFVFKTEVISSDTYPTGSEPVYNLSMNKG